MIIKLENLAIAAPTPSLYAVNKDKASPLPYIPKDHKNGSPRVAPLDSRPKVAGHMRCWTSMRHAGNFYQACD